jgi:hypothetical protein
MASSRRCWSTNAKARLLWLHRRLGKDGKPQISAAQFAAGERFRSDLTLARMLPRTTMNWDASLRRACAMLARAIPAVHRFRARRPPARRSACDRLGPELVGPGDRCLRLPEGARSSRARARLAGALGQGRAAAGAVGTRGALRHRSGAAARPSACEAWRSEDARPVFPGSPQAEAQAASSRAGVGFDPIDHGAHAVRALRRQMGGEAELLIDREGVRRRISRAGRPE